MHRYVPASGERASWPLPERIGCIARRREGGFIAGFKSGFAFLDLPEGRIEKIGDPEPERPNNRMNDGKCDAEGRFWAAQAGRRDSTPALRLPAPKRSIGFAQAGTTSPCGP